MIIARAVFLFALLFAWAGSLLPAAWRFSLVLLLATLLWLSGKRRRVPPDDNRRRRPYVLKLAAHSQGYGYFADHAHASIVLHYWSLSIEEQFYFVYGRESWSSWRSGGADHPDAGATCNGGHRCRGGDHRSRFCLDRYHRAIEDAVYLDLRAGPLGVGVPGGGGGPIGRFAACTTP